jgi:bifunctional non-homologous end joining protein LigD
MPARKKAPTKAPGDSDGPLKEYAKKRDFGKTPEPEAVRSERPGNSFVIQKHKATRLHYDFRLERDGVLVSWAVPKGLPTVAGEKRLAVQTEDHPLEYGSFEGRIPKGEYGAGEVRIFDNGTYEAPEWTDSKITVRLHGHRHQGEYHLVKTRQGWLIFLSKSSAAEQPPPAPEFAPMMAEGGYEPFSDPAWRFEPKMDGVRTLAYVTTDSTTLKSRTGRDQTLYYPEISNLAQYVNALSAVLDGEIAALEEGGRPSFERLQSRINISGPREIERMRRQIPVTIFIFDVLWIDGEDVTGLPLEKRRAILEEAVTEDGPVKLTYYLDGEGERFFEASRQLGLEGIIGKRLGSAYQPGRRSKDWRKIKALNRQDCVVLGWTAGTGARSKTFGSLLVGAYRDDELIFIGQVGTGFTDARLSELMTRLESLEVDKPPINDPNLRVKGARWVKPELVCEVEFLEMTKAGKLRAPSFKGIRTDKVPKDCILERPAV